MMIRSGQVLVYAEGNLYLLVGLKPESAPKSDGGGKPALVKVAGGIPLLDSIPEGARVGWAADVNMVTLDQLTGKQPMSPENLPDAPE